MLRTPKSTYRLQLHKDFTFDDAACIAEYLRDLGISHVYCSPYLQASPDSTHGYDVVDHQKVNEELGGAEGHERLSNRLRELGLGQVLDIVPNHMSLGRENRFWWDVLENGTSSRYASFFDIDWQPQEERLRNKVLVPVLADQYGRVLQDGGIKLARHGGLFQVECAGQVLPVAPPTLSSLLARAAEYAKSETLSFLAASFARLPAPEYVDRRTILARHRDKTVLYALLSRLCSEEPQVCEQIDRAVGELNANLDALDDLLNQQNYRLSYWKAADEQLGYRRFFDVNTLIGMRVEREHVFEETHTLVLDWLKRGVLDGVRVDHPDGLRDPLQYFQRLRTLAPDAWIVGEKILEPGEFLPESWPIQGTSGYDFLNVALGVLARSEGLVELSAVYADFIGGTPSFADVAHEKKIAVTQESLASDVNRLTSLLVEICECNRNERDYTRAQMRRAIRELASCFHVYRTYVVPERNEITDDDIEAISQATECAKSKRQDVDAGLFDFMRDVLTLRVTGKYETEFVMRFQQFTGPVMAKGVEDTAFYCYNRLTGMNEVGSDPSRDGLSVEEFHAYQGKMQKTHPLTMTSLSTHDTKRSDDVRARLAVLSEMPGRFGAAVHRWARLNADLRGTRADGSAILDRNTEYFYYQSLIGAWPITPDRIKAYMEKAMREAKQQTSWVANNKEFEDAMRSFIEKTLEHTAFLAELEQFVESVKYAGRVNSLAQTLMKHTAPGVPDLYQGTELWDFSLVDPDNRRPVDYDVRRQALKEIQGMSVAQVMERMDDGLPKLWTIRQALALRGSRPEWFAPDRGYRALKATGAKKEHVVAYLRGDNIITVVPRLVVTLDGKWGATAIALPKGRFRNIMTDELIEGGKVGMETLLREFPVALLVKE
ncbi:MAG: malto-oligosyltrehalose synthase [Acidobacteriaceae bacterium]|nr:malto-oligosyltrehalose synthase [Acidobacteriaceae bacterium]